MNRKSAPGKGAGFLVAALLAVTVFMREPQKLWAYGAVFAVWGVWMLAALLPGKKRAKAKKAAWASYAPKLPSDTVGEVLLRHVNYRISAYLQSAYPEATWEWCCKAPERIAAEGGVGRIKLHGAPGFNYADVTIDRQARISFDLLRVEPLRPAQPGSGQGTGGGAPGWQSADHAVWYDIQGRDLLESLIADLHSRGHTKLTIRENGDICTYQADEEAVQDSFSNMPGRAAWPGIARMLQKAGLAASVSDGGIEVSW